MKRLLIMMTFALAMQANAQEIEVQLAGRLIAPSSDTTFVTVWSDGELIGEEAITHRHYALVLGEKPHYTILFANGSKVKYCHILLHNMELEHIQVDVNFGSAASVLIYKHRSSAKQYTHLQYSPRGFVIKQFDKTETE